MAGSVFFGLLAWLILMKTISELRHFINDLLSIEKDKNKRKELNVGLTIVNSLKLPDSSNVDTISSDIVSNIYLQKQVATTTVERSLRAWNALLMRFEDTEYSSNDDFERYSTERRECERKLARNKSALEKLEQLLSEKPKGDFRLESIKRKLLNEQDTLMGEKELFDEIISSYLISFK